MGRVLLQIARAYTQESTMTQEHIAPTDLVIGDFITNKLTWLQSRCLIALLYRKKKVEVQPWANSQVAVAIAGELARRLKQRSGQLSIKDWLVGHLAYGVISGLPSVDLSHVYSIADTVYPYVAAVLSELSLDGDYRIFSYEDDRLAYSLGYRDRVTVSLLVDMLATVPHAVTEPSWLVKDVVARSKAIESTVSLAKRKHWLVGSTMSWLAAQAKLNPIQLNESVSFVIACANKIGDYPRLDLSVHSPLVVSIILGLPDIRGVEPVNVVQYAIGLARSLDIACSNHQRLIQFPYNYLAALVLGELARESQCCWDESERNCSAELAVRQVLDFLESANLG